jgi:alkylated DNA repair dioxygenase AlkB
MTTAPAFEDITLETNAFEDITLETIDEAHVWVNRDGAPRDECFMSTNADSYTYGRGRGVRTYDPIPYTELIEAVRKRVLQITGIDYEACFSNRYDGKLKHLGWHADDAPEIDHDHGIVVLSFGAVREIWFRLNGAKNIMKQALPHGSMLIMPAGFQQTHQHRIPKHYADCGLRVSLTFRKLL